MFFLLLQERYLFEVAAEVCAVSGGEEEAAEGVDAVDGGCDVRALVAVACGHAEAQQVREVFLFEVVAAAQGVVAASDVQQQLLQQGLQLVFTARQQSQRRGVGHPRGEGRLVDVEAYAADGVVDSGLWAADGVEAGGDEGAADLAAVDVDVVGPLDCSVK